MTPHAGSRTLRRLPREKGFYFFTSIGNYTGEHVASLEEFVRKIKEVDVKSLEFHLYRGDFEKWAADVLEDPQLAQAIRSIQNFKPVGDTLRDQLHLVVWKRYKDLKAKVPG